MREIPKNHIRLEKVHINTLGGNVRKVIRGKHLLPAEHPAEMVVHTVPAIKFCKDTMTWKHLDRNLLKNGIMKKIPFCHRKSPLHQKGTCGGSVKKVIHGEQQFQAEGN